jgi:hypothetical protein
MAGVPGFEPGYAGIKTRCVNRFATPQCLSLILVVRILALYTRILNVSLSLLMLAMNDYAVTSFPINGDVLRPLLTKPCHLPGILLNAWIADCLFSNLP